MYDLIANLGMGFGVALSPTDNVGINVTGAVPGHFYPH